MALTKGLLYCIDKAGQVIVFRAGPGHVLWTISVDTLFWRIIMILVFYD